MHVEEFVDRCVSLGYSWTEGKHNDKKGYFIGSQKHDTISHFTEEAIGKNHWHTLYRALQQGKDISYVTRVVGYYSKVQNWNRSKVGELRDRHKGEYAVK